MVLNVADAYPITAACKDVKAFKMMEKVKVYENTELQQGRARPQKIQWSAVSCFGWSVEIFA